MIILLIIFEKLNVLYNETKIINNNFHYFMIPPSCLKAEDFFNRLNKNQEK